MFGLNLGATRLWDVDEAIFAEAAVEMMDRGDLVTPFYNGHLFTHKPPFMYWCQIAAYHEFGPTEFAARLFSALFCIGTLLLTYEIGCTLFNVRTGLWAGLALAGCINFVVIGRAATPDAHLTFFSTLALLVLVRGTRAAPGGLPSNTTTPWQPILPPGWRTYAVAYAVMAVGTLVKGPVAIVIPMAVWGMFLLIEQPAAKRRRLGASPVNLPSNMAVAGSPSSVVLNNVVWFLKLFSPPYFFQTVWRMRPLTAVAALLIVAGPWYALVGWRTNGEFLREFFLVQNVQRAAHAMENHYGPFYYYLITICIGTFPWCVLMWPALTHLRRAIRGRDAAQAGYVLLVCWAAVWVGCFSILATKLASYVIPAFPAIALCFATLVDAWLTDKVELAYRRWLHAAWLTFATVGLVALIAVPIAMHILFDGELSPALIGLVPITGALVGWRQTHRRRLTGTLATLAVTSVAFCVGLLGFAALPIDAHKNTHMFAEVIQQHATGPTHLATYKYAPPSLVFYSHMFFDRLQARTDVAAHFDRFQTDAFLVTTDKQLDALQPYLPPDFEVLRTERVFLKREKVIILGRRNSTVVAAGRLRDKAPTIRSSSAN